jgi:hypothetical protein
MWLLQVKGREEALRLGLVILVLAVAFGSFLLKRWGPNTIPRDDVLADVVVGDTLCRPGRGNWATQSSKALIVATSDSCAACRSDRTVEEEVLDEARAAGLAAYVLLSPSPDNDVFAAALKRKGVQIVRSVLRSIGVTRVPAFYVVDDSNHVISYWIGAVSRDRRPTLLADLLQHKSFQSYRRISRASFAQLMDTPGSRQVIALDTPARTFGPPKTVLVIPLPQLAVRAEYELNKELETFVDCATASSAFLCQGAALTLVSKGFRRVTAIDLAQRPPTCQ